MKNLKHILNKFKISYDEETHLPIEISDVGREDLVDWLYELKLKKGVEVGTYEGEYSESICKANPQMKLWTIDPWLAYEGYGDFTSQIVLTSLFKKAKKRLSAYPKCKIMRTSSMNAIKEFRNNSLDFVYIDANHQDPYITKDITEWQKKIRVGGIMAGHDYIRMRSVSESGEWDVVSAVNRYTRSKDIRPWFVLGSSAKTPGMVRDKYRSWFWVKTRNVR